MLQPESSFGAPLAAGSLPRYRRRQPESTLLYQIVEQHFPTILVLLFHGEDDTAVLVSGHDEICDSVSADNAMLRVPGASHMVHHDAPELVNSTIRSWLDLHRESP
ncbi:MAG: alpha/beta hydrolase [Pseudomonadales bacterium]|nr:alpha/beta hydrolase [Pseudomonadales bacterium]